MMNRLSYVIRPFPEDRSHEVRWIVDGQDWIGSDAMGLDPDDLGPLLTAVPQEHLLVARCVCGVIGCGDLRVDMRRTENTVEWHCQGRKPLIFNSTDYDQLIAQLAQDHSWEPVGRTIERRLNALFRGTRTADGHVFAWLSTRCKANVLTICAIRDGHQLLWEIPWDGRSLEAGMEKGGKFLSDAFVG